MTHWSSSSISPSRQPTAPELLSLRSPVVLSNPPVVLDSSPTSVVLVLPLVLEVVGATSVDPESADPDSVPLVLPLSTGSPEGGSGEKLTFCVT